MLENRLNFRTKDKIALGCLRVVERFLTGTIARQKQCFCLVVPNRKSKHASQMLHARLAKLFVSMNDCFSVGIGFEDVAERYELLLQLAEVISLAVVNKRNRD